MLVLARREDLLVSVASTGADRAESSSMFYCSMLCLRRLSELGIGTSIGIGIGADLEERSFIKF